MNFTPPFFDPRRGLSRKLNSAPFLSVLCVSKICSNAVFGTATSIISQRQLRSYAHCQCLEIIVKDTSRAFEFILPKKARAGVFGLSHEHRLEHRAMDQAVPTFLATTTPMCTLSTLPNQNNVFLRNIQIESHENRRTQGGAC